MLKQEGILEKTQDDINKEKLFIGKNATTRSTYSPKKTKGVSRFIKS